MNTPDSYTRKDCKGRKSSPDITLAHNSLLGKYSWNPQERNPGGSDHLPILITLNLNTSNKKRRSRKGKGKARWAYKKANWEMFEQYVDQEIEKWSTESESWPLKTLSSQLSTAILKAAKRSIPRGNRPNIKPFWNEDIDKADKANNKARAECHLSDGHADTYKNTRDTLYNVTKQAKEESWKNYVSKLDPSTEPSKVWRAIAAMDGRKPKTRSGTNMTMGTKVATTDLEKANLLNKSYQQESRIQKNKTVDKPRVHAHRKAVGKCSNCDGQQLGMCCPFSMEELKTGMKRLRNGKSPGEDDISNEMIRHLSEPAKETLLKLYNLSWKLKICPKEWKSAEIVTIPKPGKDLSIPTSFRPISLLSTISKLMERLVQARLQDHLERNNKLHPNQAGFRKGRSTNEQILRLSQTLVDGLQNKQRSITTYVDFTKAYDKVWRDKLWERWAKSVYLHVL